MPCVAAIRTPIDADDSEEESQKVSTYAIPLFLPSSIKPEMRATGITSGLVEKEIRLQEALAEDSLFNLKLNLRRQATLWDHKRQHTAGTGTRTNTRMQDIIARYANKQQRDADRYRAAREALIALAPSYPYSVCFPKLRKNDICFPHKEEESRNRKRRKAEGEGRRKISWIWTRVGWDGNIPENSAVPTSLTVEMEEGEFLLALSHL